MFIQKNSAPEKVSPGVRDP